VAHPSSSRAGVQPARAVGDFFKDLFDMNSWAPKSTRIWRMQQYQPPEAREEVNEAGNMVTRLNRGNQPSLSAGEGVGAPHN
jgi:hypothetical protein